MPNNGVKFSQFPSIATINNSDQIVGLYEGANARWSFSTVLSWFQSAVSGLFVPIGRKINNKALSADITLTPSDIGAVPTTSVGVASGVASLDSSGKVPSAQLPAIPSTAAAVTYDNTGSGLTADDVQEAIDELAAGGVGGGADEATIAPVEDTTTATVAHPLGSIFYLNGTLYRALSDIAVGGTINAGTGGNATQTTIAANFSRIVKLTAAQYASLSAAEKAADIVYIVTDDPLDADQVGYDNTTSGLTATDVQEALDELAAGAGGSTAATTSYDNTDSGLAATNAQDAIDELAAEKADQTTVAPVEASTGDIAATAHPLGSLFYWNGGKLYRATADIAVGGTITVGTNIEQTNIAESIKRTVTLTSAQYAQLSAAEKAADILYVITDDPVVESYPNGSITLLQNNGYVSATSLSACDRSGSIVAIAISINLAGQIPTTRCEFGTLHGVPKPRANAAGLFQITNYLFSIQIAVNGKVYITSIGQAQGASTWSGTPLLTYSTDGTILS